MIQQKTKEQEEDETVAEPSSTLTPDKASFLNLYFARKTYLALFKCYYYMTLWYSSNSQNDCETDLSLVYTMNAFIMADDIVTHALNINYNLQQHSYLKFDYFLTDLDVVPSWSMLISQLRNTLIESFQYLLFNNTNLLIAQLLSNQQSICLTRFINHYMQVRTEFVWQTLCYQSAQQLPS